MTAVRPFRPTRLPLLVSLALSTAAAAQLPGAASSASPGYPAIARPFSSAPLLADANDPAEALARYLRTLADNPGDLAALTGAGHAALAIGDANAALAFYARAEEIAPRDGRIKAGLGSAMLQLEKPKEAIGLFDEATGLGVAEKDVAGDRGLAWDLRGDTRRAQRDYALALKANPDDETTRRLALSLAISGDAAGADALLDPLLRRQDRAAWRARAFVLAMGGDLAKAEVVARSAMSPAQVVALHPFLVRLASLRPAQKALAVNFGEMPSDGRAYSSAELAAMDGPSPIRADAALVPAGEPWGPRQASTATGTPDIEGGGGDEVPPAGAARRRSGAGNALALADRHVFSGTPNGARFASAWPPPGRAEQTAARIAATPATSASYGSARSAEQAAHRSAPVITLPPASLAPAFLAVPPPPVTVATDAPPPAIDLAAAGPEPAPSLSTLDPAIGERVAGEERGPRPVQLAAAQPGVQSPPASNAAPAPDSVALPEVGYRLPPSAPKPVPVAETIEAAKTAPAKAGESAGTSEPAGRKAARHDADAKPAPPRARALAHAEKEPVDKPETAATTSARKPAAKAPSDEGKTDAEKPSAKKRADKSAKSDIPVRDDGAKAARKAASAESKTAKTPGAKTAADDGAEPASNKAPAKKGKGDDAKGSAKDWGKGSKTVAKKDDDDKPGKSEAKSADAKSDTRPDKAAPQRVWVQVAGGATKGDLPKAWSRLKANAPALAKGQSAYTTPLKATNRLLVGPFKSADEAQAYVNRMSKAGLSGFTFSSDKGQQVDKLDTGK